MTAGSPERQEGMRRAVRQDGARSRLEPRPVVRFVADLVCPWCYLAFARLLRALAGASSVELLWQPFLLNPHLPPGGVTRAHYLERKFGSLAQARSIQRRVAEAGAREGLAFSFRSIKVQPNTTMAHALVLAAAAEDRLPDAAEALFRAFFLDGADIGDRRALVAIAAGLGLAERSRERFVGPAALEEVTAAHGRAYALGVSGVPLCVFGDDHVIAGAQSVEAMAALLDLELYRAGAPAPPPQGRHAS
jgi:predicted DsbA family dithiol-disulfide isomerase